MKVNLKKLALIALGVALIGGSYLLQAGTKVKYQKITRTSPETELFQAINKADLDAVKNTENLKNLLTKKIKGLTPIQQAAAQAKELASVKGMYFTSSDNEKYKNWLLIIKYLLDNGSKEKELKNYPQQLEAVKTTK